ncbi:hypothetical protein ACFL2Q_16810 [Thermodesulfobacteriota bacterium]
MSHQEAISEKVLHDLHSGLQDTALMEKHGLTLMELRAIYRDLFDTGLLLQPQLHTASATSSVRHNDPPPPPPAPSFRTAEVKNSPGARNKNRRGLQRYLLDFEIPIYELEHPESLGRVRDITEIGAGTVGVSAREGEVKTLVVLGDFMEDVSPFEFQAKCQWAKKDRGDGGMVAGFRITDISEADAEELQKLVELGTA